MTTRAAEVRKLPVGARIRWARERKGISQERFAEIVGTSRRHMIRIEKGQHLPGPRLVARISEATEQPEEFFSNDDEEESQPVAHLTIDEFLRMRIEHHVSTALATLTTPERV